LTKISIMMNIQTLKTFTTDVKNEIDKGVKFPLENPEYVIVKSDKFWETFKKAFK
jgi:hypothetical protein